MEKVSNCCGEPNRAINLDGPDWEDIGMCPGCQDSCEFIEEQEDECEE